LPEVLDPPVLDEDDVGLEEGGGGAAKQTGGVYRTRDSL
jgi:hypothetical protein